VFFCARSGAETSHPTEAGIAEVRRGEDRGAIILAVGLDELEERYHGWAGRRRDRNQRRVDSPLERLRPAKLTAYLLIGWLVRCWVVMSVVAWIAVAIFLLSRGEGDLFVKVIGLVFWGVIGAAMFGWPFVGLLFLQTLFEERYVEPLGTPAAFRREPIPERVRHEVWRRDLGTCVDCGTRERLEYDHIVPVSRGGSNTARNIELRCEPCNRRKGASI